MHSNMSRIKHYAIIGLLLATTSCANRQTVIARLLSEPANGLLQVKTNNQHTIAMEVMPNNTNTHTGTSNEPGFLRVKLTLRSNQKMKGSAVLQYMNFGIQHSLSLIRGADSLPCIICERIPGISEKEFLYLAFFDGTRILNNQGTVLQLLVADTVAGFGTTVFDIKIDAIKKLEAIKQ